ncbi:MAG: hypothetical protein EBU90_05075 [Proteobacteria bacterium]|nr:hypothetical protein [Pseudomonadota bacterium]
MVNCKKNLKIYLNDLGVNLNSQKSLFESIAYWMSNDEATNIEFVGTDEQITVIKNAILETKRFQDALFNENATLENVFDKLRSKHLAANSFSISFGMKWVF